MAENKKRVSIGLTDAQYALVQKFAKEKGFSKSAIFVLALEEYARKESEQKNK
ncbi:MULTISPECIES: CopG family transcriptional regulator [Lactobacillaceae]|uniref:CopG family transcriptional regulator n=1 Tax=Lactobacillaceae TaxID=33958 RepID=UPI0006D1492A|nr:MULTISPECIES: CopG family transcriptional regulator [Lactobacillaceae]MBU7478972.1 CopG family transcriptional regulator [Lactiplantibacillus pentosus]MBU7536764.1 CopG family transcriptional regulator [Lactiplantibacillus pentosus]MCW6118676.1 CopG family transcriptional regulator [Lactiplantibacillus plantarum]MPQ20936.1 CopG family transcriptional regulator [Lactiplantibacillus pentosus]